MHLKLIVAVLACWRLSNMLVKEDGPFDVLSELRARTGIEYDINNEPTKYPNWNPLHCIWCTSVWIAPLIMWLPVYLTYGLAISAGACLIDRASIVAE